MRFRRYPSMKGSEVEWIGDMPSHWRLERFKYLFEERNERGFPNEPLLAATQTRGVVRKEDYENRTVMALKDLENLKLVRVGDFVISLRSFEGGIEYAHVQGIISPAYTILRPRNDVVRGYYARLFKSPSFIENLNLYTTGIRDGQNIDYKAFRHSLVPVPPVDEQKAIAEFLDRRVEQLDSLVKKVQLFVERLQEYRQALITQAVTRGLDPNVPMKDSGIPWLGVIPEHWRVVKLKRIAAIRYGLSQPPRELEGGVPFIRATNVSRGKIIPSDLMYVDPADVPREKKPVLQENEIIVVRSGAYTGDSAIVSHEYIGAIAGYDMVVSVTGANPHYVAYCLLSDMVLVNQIYVHRMRAAQPHLNAEELGDCLICLPSESEQSQIASFLRDRLGSVNALMSEMEVLSSVLSEYRQALITAAVTGKIDVRQEVQEHAG